MQASHITAIVRELFPAPATVRVTIDAATITVRVPDSPPTGDHTAQTFGDRMTDHPDVTGTWRLSTVQRYRTSGGPRVSWTYRQGDAAPVVHADPAPPADGDNQLITADRDILGRFQMADPAQVDEVGVATIRQRALQVADVWHDLALHSAMPTPPWRQILTPDTHSGHKLHIAASALAEARQALAAVFGVCWRAGLGIKVCTAADVLANTGGKGVVVYLPRRHTVDRDVSLIAAALDGYRPAGRVGPVGSTHVEAGLWWRFEFSRDPGRDAWAQGEYRSLYLPASPNV